MPRTALCLVLFVVHTTCYSQDKNANVVIVLGPASDEVSRFSWKAIRDTNVVKQQFDFSCGAASLATILTHFFNHPVTELEILELLEVRDNAASFSDLKNVAELHFGIKAIGLVVNFDSLLKLKVPAIAHLVIGGIEHFSVIRGIDSEGNVWLADPAFGNRFLTKPQFLSIWIDDDYSVSGKLLILVPTGSTTTNKEYFARENLSSRRWSRSRSYP
ncbi:MAG: hypothetical protein JJ956_15835 [Pseudomonadales bacterium]|nr:hypothetical protein [Pseudomonadales bacterium]